MTAVGRILLVEDDPKDLELTLAALEEYRLVNEVAIARDGQEVRVPRPAGPRTRVPALEQRARRREDEERKPDRGR